eukprot:TRINITY_DN2433_c0_g1_i1.p3 TRINITY_DN2433_c0_g1~~TRINITY_DN2433_c0_g1_i1.p3  ORF type:complete len:151 (+),score=8.38 TRINITY_DN2433_c0_g1_i1:544-996(+)
MKTCENFYLLSLSYIMDYFPFSAALQDYAEVIFLRKLSYIFCYFFHNQDSSNQDRVTYNPEVRDVAAEKVVQSRPHPLARRSRKLHPRGGEQITRAGGGGGIQHPLPLQGVRFTQAWAVSGGGGVQEPLSNVIKSASVKLGVKHPSERQP